MLTPRNSTLCLRPLHGSLTGSLTRFQLILSTLRFATLLLIWSTVNFGDIRTIGEHK